MILYVSMARCRIFLPIMVPGSVRWPHINLGFGSKRPIGYVSALAWELVLAYITDDH